MWTTKTLEKSIVAHETRCHELWVPPQIDHGDHLKLKNTPNLSLLLSQNKPAKEPHPLPLSMTCPRLFSFARGKFKQKPTWFLEFHFLVTCFVGHSGSSGQNLHDIINNIKSKCVIEKRHTIMQLYTKNPKSGQHRCLKPVQIGHLSIPHA